MWVLWTLRATYCDVDSLVPLGYGFRPLSAFQSSAALEEKLDAPLDLDLVLQPLRSPCQQDADAELLLRALLFSRGS